MALSRILATWFGLGRIPWAPGTWGTLGAVPLVAGFSRLGDLPWMGVTVAFVFFACLVAELFERGGGLHDASEVVIDEVAGFAVAMMWIPLEHWQFWVVGFVLFRILDVWKPLWIGEIDRKVPGGFGVVMDDVLSGLVTNMVLQLLEHQTEFLRAL